MNPKLAGKKREESNLKKQSPNTNFLFPSTNRQRLLSTFLVLGRGY